MILFAAGFLACLLVSGALVWVPLRRGRARREQRVKRAQEQVEARRRVEDQMERLRRGNDKVGQALAYHRGFGDGVQWLFNRLVETGEVEREGPAERAIRESWELYEDDG